MTPAARVSAAISVLDQVLAGDPAEQALLRWSRGARYAGSGDRAAVRDLVFDALRRRNSLAARGGGLTGRGLMIGLCHDHAAIFTGEAHAPAPLTASEAAFQGGTADDLPDWLRPLWDASLGPDAEQIAQMMGQRAPVWLRVNPRRGTRADAIAALRDDGVTVEGDPRLETALCVTDGARRIAAGRAYRDGLVELQDLSPQLACAALPLVTGARVLDLCAGGGGKALALAARDAGLRIVAHDIDPARMRDLPSRAARAGVQVELARQPKGRFDLVLGDVPCSGSGTWRRTPDAKWRLTQAGLDRLIATQSAILDQAAALVAPGGHLAYMTCSLLSPENEGQIAPFLDRHPEFSLDFSRRWTPVTASDGFFMAVMRRG